MRAFPFSYGDYMLKVSTLLVVYTRSGYVGPDRTPGTSAATFGLDAVLEVGVNGVLTPT